MWLEHRPLDGWAVRFLGVGCVGFCFYGVRFVRFYPLCSFIAAWIAAYLPTVFLRCLSSVMCLLCGCYAPLQVCGIMWHLSTVIPLLFHCKTHHRARLLPRPACVSSIVYRVERAEEFFRLVRACFNNSVVCSGVNFLSYSIAKAVAIASAISSLVAVYRFI